MERKIKEQTGNNDEGKDTQTIDAVRERGQKEKLETRKTNDKDEGK